MSSARNASTKREVGGFSLVDSVKLADKIKTRIIGQDAQVEGICKCVCNHLRKKSPKKPLVIMLPGPTGVGKTATAQYLAECLQEMFGTEYCSVFRLPTLQRKVTASPFPRRPSRGLSLDGIR